MHLDAAASSGNVTKKQTKCLLLCCYCNDTRQNPIICEENSGGSSQEPRRPLSWRGHRSSRWMVWRSLLSGDLPEVQAEGTASLRAGMWNEFCVFKEVKESQCLRSKVSKEEEAGDTVRETSRAQPQRTSQALSRTLQFRLRRMGSFCGGAVRKWFTFDLSGWCVHNEGREIFETTRSVIRHS